MTPDEYHDFFVASAGAAAALIGLLFVAISVAPERLLADDAAQTHRVRATAALTSFTNALTVSLFALVPGLDVGWTAAIVAVVGLRFVSGSLISLLRVLRREPAALRDSAFLAGLVAVFALQLYFGVRLIAHDDDSGAVRGLAVLVITCFLIGIFRSWELIGGPTIGLRGELATALRARRRRNGGDGDAPDGERDADA